MSYETNDKMVSHPDHYKSGRYEVIDIIDEFTKDLSGTEAVCTANAIKYILRWKKKNGIQDVKKAIWYLQHMVDKEEERLREEHTELDDKRLEKKALAQEALKNAINLAYGLKSEKEENLEISTCKECRYFPEIYCSFTGWSVTADKPMCACFEEKRFEDPFANIQPIKDDTKYTKEVDLNTGKVTVTPLNKTTYSKKVVDEALKNWKPKLELENCAHCENFDLEPNGILGHCKHSIYSDGRIHRDCVCSNFEKKLEPGCDKCEISECKFLEDPFMNPPYNELLDKCRAQKEIINDLLRDKKEMQDSIDLLEDDKKILKECNDDLARANDDLLNKLFDANKENADLNKKILERDLKIKELRESNMYGNDPTCGTPVKIEKEVKEEKC